MCRDEEPGTRTRRSSCEKRCQTPPISKCKFRGREGAQSQQNTRNWVARAFIRLALFSSLSFLTFLFSFWFAPFHFWMNLQISIFFPFSFSLFLKIQKASFWNLTFEILSYDLWLSNFLHQEFRITNLWILILAFSGSRQLEWTRQLTYLFNASKWSSRKWQTFKLEFQLNLFIQHCLATSR